MTRGELDHYQRMVRRKREILRLTKTELAQHTFLTPSFLSNLELGRRRLTEDVHATLQSYFESRLPDILKLMNDANPDIRIDACEAFGDQHNIPIAEIMKRVYDSDPRVRIRAVLVFCKRIDCYEDWIQKMVAVIDESSQN